MAERPVFTETQIDRWAELYASGLSCRQVGVLVGVSTVTVYNRLTDRGVEFRPPGAPGNRVMTLPPKTVARLVAGYRKGRSIKTLATAEGMSMWLTRKALIAGGAQIRPPRGSRVTPDQGLSPAVRVRIVDLYRAGSSLADVATRSRLGVRVVRRILTLEGVPIRPAGNHRRRRSP